jgi:phage terminase small subunit
VSLTPKQERFVQEYLIDLNATAAYKRAGYVAKGHAAEASANRLLRNAEVAREIAQAQQGRSELASATAKEVLDEIQRLAMFDPADLTDVKSPADIKNLPEDVRRAIVGWSWDRQGRFQIKTAKEGALELLGRHHSLFNDKLKIDANVKGQVAYKANIPQR